MSRISSRRTDSADDGHVVRVRFPWAIIVAAVLVLAGVAVAVGAVRSQSRLPQSGPVADPYAPTLAATSASSTIQPDTVEVPEVGGMRREDARVVLAAAGLTVVEHLPAGVEESTRTSALTVGTQVPAAKDLVSSGTTVTLTFVTASSVAKKQASPVRRWVVCIDPGHQEHGDSAPEPLGPRSKVSKPRVTGGTTGVITGIPEYEITLQIAMNLRARLQAKGVRVVMTRTTNDVSLSNAERARIANKVDADLFVRIHGDGSPDSDTSGVSTLYPQKNAWTRSFAGDSKRAARLAQLGVLRTTGAVNRGIRQRGDMTGFNWAKMPSILMECGFLSNPVEDRLLASPHYQDKITTGLADGILAYLNESAN